MRVAVFSTKSYYECALLDELNTRHRHELGVKVVRVTDYSPTSVAEFGLEWVRR